MQQRKVITLFHAASIVAWIAAAVLSPAMSFGQVTGMTLDQENENYGYYTYNTHGGWQSFTAGTNGHLGAVQLWLYSTGTNSGYSGGGDWTAILRIYEGEGTGGRILAEQPVSGDGLLQRRTFTLETPVRQTAGTQYTVYFGGSATHLTVRLSGDAYAGGMCASGATYDYNFKTHVITSDWSEEAYRDTSFTAADTVISNAAQLAQFAYLVNNGNQYFGKTITLANDISLAGHFWSPICTAGTFAGTFDGSNRTIRCVIANRPGADNQGLFGYVGGTIQNVNVADVDITGRDQVGGLAGDGFGAVSNCTVSGTVAGRFCVSGVLGYGHGSMLEACINRCRVTGASEVGGVVGLGGNNPISRCRNEGSVEGSGSYVGGVIGHARADVRDCSNAGPVSGTTGQYVAGVVGQSAFDVLNCRNSGNVSGAMSVGGIVGAANGGALTRCANTGNVSGNTAVGGIAGLMDSGGMQNCANSGAVDGAVGAGGLAGGQESFVFNSVNSGAVTGGRGVGGVMGISEFGGECHNCQNSGAVSGSQYVGALAGVGGVLTNCYWKQTGVAPFDLDPAGDGAVTLQECRPFGAAPGTLAAPVTLLSDTDEPVTTSSLSGALNAYVIASAVRLGGRLRRWTSGSATAYPAPADTRWSDAGNYNTNWYSAAASHLYIGTAEELAGLAVLVSGGRAFTNQTVTLTADITLTDREWVPIGSSVSGASGWFHGTFEGNGKTVTGAWQDASYMASYEVGGLFGALFPGSTVRNLALVDSQSVAQMAGGGIVGLNGGTVQNCACNGFVMANLMGGGVAGYTTEESTIENCYVTGFSFTDQAAGGIAGVNLGAITNCYWRNTGVYPLDQDAIGDGNAVVDCRSFSNAPGTLATPVTVGGVTADSLSTALNAWVDGHGGAGSGLYNWTAGSAERFPRLTPVIAVGGTPVPQELSEGFAVGATLTDTAATVAAYTNAHPGTTAASLGDVLCQAEAMGFGFAELDPGAALLDFEPSLTITDFDTASWTLTFTASNGIDATATAAMHRLAGSTARLLQVRQMDQLGGGQTPLPVTLQFHGDGTAKAMFDLADPPAQSFFRLILEHHPE